MCTYLDAAAVSYPTACCSNKMCVARPNTQRHNTNQSDFMSLWLVCEESLTKGSMYIASCKR